MKAKEKHQFVTERYIYPEKACKNKKGQGMILSPRLLFFRHISSTA
jgi:hypothetical protein